MPKRIDCNIEWQDCWLYTIPDRIRESIIRPAMHGYGYIESPLASPTGYGRTKRRYHHMKQCYVGSLSERCDFLKQRLRNSSSMPDRARLVLQHPHKRRPRDVWSGLNMCTPPKGRRVIQFRALTPRVFPLRQLNNRGGWGQDLRHVKQNEISPYILQRR